MLFTPRRAARLKANVPNLYRLQFRHTDFRTPSLNSILLNTSLRLYEIFFPGFPTQTQDDSEAIQIPDAFTGLSMRRLARALKRNTVVEELVLDQILDFDSDALCQILSGTQSLKRVIVSYTLTTHELHWEKIFAALANIKRSFILVLYYSSEVKIDFKRFETLLKASETTAAVRIPAGIFSLRDGKVYRESPSEYSSRIKIESGPADQSTQSVTSSQNSLDLTWASVADQSRWKQLNKLAVRDLLNEFEILQSQYAPNPVPIYPLLQRLFELREEMDEQCNKRPELVDAYHEYDQQLLRSRFGMLRPEKQLLSTTIYPRQGPYTSFYSELRQRTTTHLEAGNPPKQILPGVFVAEVKFRDIMCTEMMFNSRQEVIQISHCPIEDSPRLLQYANSVFAELQQPDCERRLEKIANIIYALIHAQVLRGGMAACCEMFAAFLHRWKKIYSKYQNRETGLPMDLAALFEFTPANWPRYYRRHCHRIEGAVQHSQPHPAVASAAVESTNEFAAPSLSM